MLDLMRQHAYSWTTRVVLGFITVIFIFWGVGTGLFSQVHPVATVNGRRILANEVEREANRLRRSLEQVYGPNASRVLRGVNLRQEALDRIIVSRLAADEARHIGIRVSRAALERRIAAEAAFQAGGQFNFRQYEDVLRDHDMLPNEYEASMREAMAEDAVRRMVGQAVQASDQEIRHAYDLKNELLSAAYVVVPYEDFTAKAAPTPRQAEDFYQKSRELFREPERVRIVYIHYDPRLLAAKIAPGEKEIASYYQRNLKARFTHPEQVHARHILVAVAGGATSGEKTAAQAKAESILGRLRKGADFAKLAKAYSEDPGSRSTGGDLGAFGRGRMIKPFEDAVFSMKPGEVRVVETKFGFHVVKLDAFIPAHTDTLKEAEPKIIEALRAQAGARMAREALDQDVAAALSGQGLEEIAGRRGLEAVRTPAVSADEAAAVLRDAHLAEAAFKLNAGQVRAVTGGGAPYLVKLVSREPSRIPPFKEIEAKARAAYISATAQSEARARARELLGQVKRPGDFDRMAAANQLKVHKTGPFKRSDQSVPGIGSLPEVADAAATLPKTPGVIGRVMEAKGDSYLFEALTRTPPPDDQWKHDAASFTGEFLKERRAEAWSRFLDVLKSRARITVDGNQLGREAPGPST